VKNPGGWKNDEALICLLFKKGERDDINNWRPISLLNVDYKILAAVENWGLKWRAAPIVGKFQHGFLPGRSIHEEEF